MSCIHQNGEIALGLIGITLNMNWFEPLNYTDSNHVEASETKLQFYAGWFANPIYINGKYPNIMRQKVKYLHILLCQVNLHCIPSTLTAD